MPRPLRVLILSADVGESHVVMARVLRDALVTRGDIESVHWRNDFSVLGPLLGRLLPRGFRLHLGRVKWSYDWTYRAFTRMRLLQRLGERALYALGGGALARTISSYSPDVVVSTYPVMNPVLARLRAHGQLDCPAVAVVGPLGGLGFWVQPDLDLHLALYPEALPEINRLAGSESAVAVRPLIDDTFLSPATRQEARAALGLDPARPLVLISGGGWGAGDLAAGVSAALALPGVQVVAVAGRNDGLRAELASRWRHERRLLVLGFTDRMRDLLCAADVFVTSTAGSSCLEARCCGCPVICFGFFFGHVRDNTAALRHHGFATTAATVEQLAHRLREVLRERARDYPDLDALPAAADVVAEMARMASDKPGSTARALPAAV
jgi:UDP-N-acetylglucosamine:LPS N-acetylglucosamine transferase